MRRFLLAFAAAVLIAVTGCSDDATSNERRPPTNSTTVLTPPRHRRQRRRPDLFERSMSRFRTKTARGVTRPTSGPRTASCRNIAALDPLRRNASGSRSHGWSANPAHPPVPAMPWRPGRLRAGADGLPTARGPCGPKVLRALTLISRVRGVSAIQRNRVCTAPFAHAQGERRHSDHARQACGKGRASRSLPFAR